MNTHRRLSVIMLVYSRSMAHSLLPLYWPFPVEMQVLNVTHSTSASFQLRSAFKTACSRSLDDDDDDHNRLLFC